MANIKTRIRQSFLGKKLWPFLYKLKRPLRIQKKKRMIKMMLVEAKKSQKHIFYCGVCESSNMGDIAQTYCTLNWMARHYPEHKVLLCRTSVFMDKAVNLIGAMKKVMTSEDLIFFQSGYNTHDLGGNEDFMHQKVIQAFPKTEIIMLPQTVNFISEERKKQCQNIYNQHPKMLFLARDMVSLALAEEMFPDLTVLLYPDIVTTLIGANSFSEVERKGIYLCRRNDVEGFYTEKEYQEMATSLRKLCTVNVSDTIISAKNEEIFQNLGGYVQHIVADFAQYRLVVTDKFHGLIFSLAANTPVVLLKTKDHKVTSAYTWFSKIFPDRVFYADNQEMAKQLSLKILESPNYGQLDDYFKREYYDKLKNTIEAWEKELESK